MDDILPSIRFETDEPRPVGFVEQVDDQHLCTASDALSAVAQSVSEVAEKHTGVLCVRFCSVRYMPTLPFVLYGFHIVAIDDDGEYVDELTNGREVSYALVTNHAVEVQREAALLFLYELVFRQEALQSVRDTLDTSLGQLDTHIAAAVAEARREYRDRIHEGWLHAAKSIALRAAAAGLTLSVRYECDALPTRSDVVRRMPKLRAAYNDIDVAREAVDKQVSMIGGNDPRIVAPLARQAQVDTLQRHLASLGVRQWISQTTRDAEVCGNGYMVTSTTPEPALYALRPEEVEILAPDRFALIRGGARQPVDGHVMHLRGIDQFASPYGISYLEPVLAEHHTRQVFERASEAANKVLAARGLDSDEGRWAQQTLGLARRSLAESDERMARLLDYPRTWLKSAREGLYFPGQDRM